MVTPRHFDGKRFYNPDAPQASGFLAALRWKLSSRPEPSPGFISDVEPSIPPRCVEGTGLRTTLVNHSTVLLQQPGCNILTDPIWSERASPLSWAGPGAEKRRESPGRIFRPSTPFCSATTTTTTSICHAAPAGRARRFRISSFPPGSADCFGGNIGPVHELDWGESVTPGLRPGSRSTAFRLSISPAGEFRPQQDSVVRICRSNAGERLVYFAGDTGFGPTSPGSANSSDRRAWRYCPSEHTSRAGSCRRCTWVPTMPSKPIEILAAGTSIAIHHGTFQMADEGLDTPAKLLGECAPSDSFLILKNGQSADIP